MNSVLDDPRVKHSPGTGDGSLDIELVDGPWIAYPQGSDWMALPYNGKDTREVGPVATVEEAVVAVLAL